MDLCLVSPKGQGTVVLRVNTRRVLIRKFEGSKPAANFLLLVDDHDALNETKNGNENNESAPANEPNERP